MGSLKKFLTLLLVVLMAQQVFTAITNDQQCKNKGGTCKNPKNCSGTVLSNLCPGGNDNKCCVPKTTKMKINQKGLDLIKSFESLKLTAYKPTANDVWTIGYGHTKGVRQGMTITKAQAEQYLKEDVAGAENAVNKYQSKYKFTSNQFSALVSFAYNIGSIDQLTANGSRSIAQIRAKIPEYNKQKGKVLAGLTRRRQAELKLFDTK